MRSRSSCTAPFKSFTHELADCACLSGGLGQVRCTQMNSGLHFKIAVVAPVSVLLRRRDRCRGARPMPPERFRPDSKKPSPTPILAAWPTLPRSALAGRSIMAHCFGSLFGHHFEFRSSPSSCSFHIRNCARRHRCQHRGDDGFALVSFRNDHEVGIASREVKAHKLAAGTLNQLANRRLSVLRCATSPLAYS